MRTRSVFSSFVGVEVHCTARHHGGDRVLVDHLRHGVTQQHHVLIERLDVTLQLDAVNQVNGHWHVLTTQKVQEGVCRSCPLLLTICSVLKSFGLATLTQSLSDKTAEIVYRRQRRA